MRSSILLAITLLGSVSCRAPRPAAGAPGAAQPATASTSTATAAGSDAGTSSDPAPTDAESDSVQGGRSLPELMVENIGLHIGGGPNDAETKAPFLRAVEAHFNAFRRCYRLVELPQQGGVYGVDLHIGRGGGRPEVRAARTGMRGREFRDCMKGAFSDVEFAAPSRGPTVISYSLRFSLEG